MAKPARSKTLASDPYVGKSVRIKGECLVLAHYPAAASVPERLMVKVGALTTVIPTECVEVAG